VAYLACLEVISVVYFASNAFYLATTALADATPLSKAFLESAGVET